MAILRLVALLAVPWLSTSDGLDGLDGLESPGGLRGLAIEKELIQLDQWLGRNDGKNGKR